MPYTVAGTLKLPETGQPAAGVILKFIALQSISPVLDRFESVIVTSSTGAYSIQLEYNTYSVFATLYDNKPINCGQIVLNSTVATGLDLPTLLNDGFSEPTTPSWIVELQRLADVTTSAAQAAATSANVTTSAAQAAATSVSQASTSATASSASASQAASSASQAAASATSAGTKAAQAAASATSAATSATASSASATSAATSATASSASATSAGTKAAQAAASATSAATSASQASTSAAAAAASAAQASQISGLSTVAEAIGLAAIPLPDVWAPLSDSLRMITGYGREVKVGEDVVSQMVNFSRNSTATYIGKDGQLKTAAVNEPRFEKEGLLIEGQSTNLVVQSEISPKSFVVAISPSAVQGYNLHSCVYTSGDDGIVIATGAALQAPDGTASFVFNSATVVGSWSCYFNETDNYFTFWPKNSSVFAYADLGNGLIRVSRKLKGTTLNTIHFRCGRVAGSRIDIGCYQIEALPFASSYIPTNGAAVTRAAEIINIPASGNFPWNGVASSGELTIAFNVKAAGDLSPNGVMNIVSFEGQYSYNGLRLREVFGKTYFSALISGFDTNETTIPVNPKINNLVGVRITPTKVSVFANGNIKETVGTLNQVIGTLIGLGTGADGRILYGHIRNLRIWHKFLTDEQIKAIA